MAWKFKVALATLLICFASNGAQAQGPYFRKVIWVVFENADYASAMAQPDFAQLAQKGALFQHFNGDTLLVVTFDESESHSSNKIYTVLLGENIQAGIQISQVHNHISILKLIEDQLQLGNLGRADLTAPPIMGLWK